MSGYGSCDDEALRASIRVEEAVALVRLMIPQGHGTSHCLECGTTIPAERRKAMPGTTFCIDCQPSHEIRPVYREPWAT